MSPSSNAAGQGDDAHIYSTNTGSRRSSLAPALRSAGNASIVGTPMVHQADETFRRLSAAVPNLADLTTDAKHGADNEKSMGFLEAVRLYPKGVFFSFGLSLAVIMEGFDTALLGSFWALPAFAKKYGHLAMVDGIETYVISASWQQAFAGSTVAQMIGLMLNGWVSDRIGYRYTMMGALISITLSLFVTFFATDIRMLLAGYCLTGLPWGIFQTISVTYASEVMPVALRPYLTTYVNLCWVIGQLISAGTIRGVLTMDSQWAYRIPFALQWIWPLPIFIICFFAPESPWWLVRHDKIPAARAALNKLTSRKNMSFNVENTLAMMIHTNQLEIQQSSGTAYTDCFKGTDLRRTEVTVMTWLMQQTCGSAMIGWAVYFMTQVGLSKSSAYSLGVGNSALAFAGTVLSWFLMPHFGRRTLYLSGQAIMLVGLLTIGFLGIPKLSSPTGWAIGGLMLLLTFIYDLTVGPVCYSLVAEIPSTRLRIKTVVIARTVFNVAGILIGLLQPQFMNPTAWNWGAKASLFWAGINLLGLVWTYFRLPEPKGLTYAELDVLFENRVSARKFTKVHVDPFQSDNLVVVSQEVTEKPASKIVENEYGASK
ncbi:hypothetical protein RBB50_005275 [Rhinocladiella similis]